MSVLDAFHPAVRAWFERRFPLGPTEPQAQGWPAIAGGEDTLIAAPTGSGKTLAAFLVMIDRLLRERADAVAGEDATEVVYVSPLKALAADIQQNLETPLAEIRATAAAMGLAAPALRALLRTGDTPSSARAAMIKRPPHLLVTTPESLYLLVTSAKSRERLRSVRTVIVDEIHAVARDKRGAHLALTLERLDALCERRPQRIGLSATQRPIEAIARLLVGAGEGRTRADGAPACRVIDLGHRRALDLALDLPQTPLEAVASHEQWGEILDKIAGHVAEHRTTLVFVNTRRLAERLAHLLAERVGEDRVAAHHGSLSKDRRLKLEARLRAGDLKVLVATASLELGIDIGPVELVCQIGSPRSLATFLQRVGRSGHARGATPKGRLYPTTRDELVESAALLRGVRAGRLDRVLPPVAPLDILAQQIVAACAGEAWSEDDLYALVRRAAPFADLARADFDAVVEMLAEGIQTGRGRRGAWLHRDRVNGVLRGRRGARIVAVTSGGAIPETADYSVVADPDDTVVGTVNEDLAIESMAGDIFLLGSTSWRIRRVEAGVVRVVDAQGAPPTVPFWLGEAPARTAELSAEVGDLRARVGAFLAAHDAPGALAWLERECGLGGVAAAEIVGYLGAAQLALGVLPTQEDLVFERFFDEAGGMQLVIHSPFGGRINRAPRLGIAQALLPPLRLRAAGGGERRRDGALARAGPELPARGRAALPDAADGAGDARPGAAALADVPGALALEPRPRAHGPAPARRPAQSAAHPAHGGRRPDGRGLPRAGRLPGERRRRSGRDPRSPDGAADDVRLPARGDRRGRARGVARSARGGPGAAPLRRHSRALAAVARDPERPALHLSRRCAARGAADARGGAPPRPARQRARAGAPRSRCDRPRARRGPAGSARCRGAARRAARAGRAAARGAMVGLVRRAVPGRTRRGCRHGGGRALARDGAAGACRRALPRGGRRARRPAARVVAVSRAPGDRRGGGDGRRDARAPRHPGARDGGRSGRARGAARERRRAGPRQARGRGLRAARPLRSGAR